MSKKTILLAVLIFGVIGAASSQDAGWRPDRQDEGSSQQGRSLNAFAASDAEKPAIVVIVNETGFTIRNIYICKADNEDWGNNNLANALYNKESVNITLDQPDRESLYNVRLVDADGDFYTKYNVKIRERTTIKVGISDFEWVD